MKKIIVNWEIAHENDLVREEMDLCGTDNILDFFEGDPDILKIDGKNILFTEIAGVIVYIDPEFFFDEKMIENKLSSFFNGEAKPIEGISGNMDTMQNGICFRGGSGYVYSLLIF